MYKQSEGQHGQYIASFMIQYMQYEHGTPFTAAPRAGKGA